MSKQLREGHEVYLLTLTKGGATKQRFKYDYSVEEMGDVRLQEMLNVEAVLGLSGMTVLDLPDSGLKEMDPKVIEENISEYIRQIEPHVVVTYPVHGISGFHDHIVTHAVVKRVYLDIKSKLPTLKRLAFYTLSEEEAVDGFFRLNSSTPLEIDCVIEVGDDDIAKNLDALDCYVTFQETIENTGIRDKLGQKTFFEIFQENHDPPLRDLFEKL